MASPILIGVAIQKVHCCRFTCIAPLGVPHYTRQTVWTSDKKYCIPAGTNIVPNLHLITNNPDVFPNPRQFLPERFLDSNNNFTKHDHNIVFGIGNDLIRLCDCLN